MAEDAADSNTLSAAQRQQMIPQTHFDSDDEDGTQLREDLAREAREAHSARRPPRKRKRRKRSVGKQPVGFEQVPGGVDDARAPEGSGLSATDLEGGPVKKRAKPSKHNLAEHDPSVSGRVSDEPGVASRHDSDVCGGTRKRIKPDSCTDDMKTGDDQDFASGRDGKLNLHNGGLAAIMAIAELPQRSPTTLLCTLFSLPLSTMITFFIRTLKKRARKSKESSDGDGGDDSNESSKDDDEADEPKKEYPYVTRCTRLFTCNS
jgi:hypothetical protein